MDQRIIDLFDEYTHKPLSRQEFLNRLMRLTGTMVSAMAILPLLEVNIAQAAIVKDDDPEIISEMITYSAGVIKMQGYLASPRNKKKKGAVVVIHENRGLNAHIKDIARRVAKAGFIALAPDALSGTGGTPANEDEARELIGKLDNEVNLRNFLESFNYLKSRKNSNNKTAVLGFCWGGAMANQIAIHDPLLNAAVSFYGRQPNALEVNKIKGKIQLHYGGLDERINAGITTYEKALKDAEIKYELYIYEGAQHAFHNDTAPTRYNEAAAKLAWERTLKLFKETIS